MILLVIKWILIMVKVSECVIDTCDGNNKKASTKAEEMCHQSTTLGENSKYSNVSLSLLEQENNCSCNVSVKNVHISVDLEIIRLNNLTEEELCGMEIDIYQHGPKEVILLKSIPTRCNSTDHIKSLSLFGNEHLQFVSRVVKENFLIEYCIQIRIVHKNDNDNSYLEMSCDQAIAAPMNTPTHQQTTLNDVTTLSTITTPIDTPNHPQSTLNDVMTSTSSQIISTLSTITSMSDKSQIHDKTDSEGDSTLFIAVGAGGGFVLLVSVMVVILLCKRRKSHHSGKEENNANNRANSAADDDDDDGLKYNVMYVSSERHDDIDVNYSTVDGDIPRRIRGDAEGDYSTVDDNKNIQVSSLNTHKVTSNAAEDNEDNGVGHINAPTESGCVYAVVDKSHKTNNSVENIETAHTSAVYAIVDKNRVKHPDEGNK